jgi:DNA/RNA-binding domain of Phe-tRNA-synthetase-like protein
MALFTYQPDLLARYPNLVGGVVAATGLSHPAQTPPALRAEYEAEQQAAIARVGKRSLSEIESLAAWRAAFRAFGVDPTQYRCAAESLLRRLAKEGNIPLINTLVDLGNLVSIRYGLPVAVIDQQNIVGGLKVHFAAGTERYTTLNEADKKHPEPGEVVFSDADDVVFARRWCWRQSDQSAARPSTSNLLITLEAHHKNARPAVEKGVADLVDLLTRFAGAQPDQVSSAILDAGQPSFSPKL